MLWKLVPLIVEYHTIWSQARAVVSCGPGWNVPESVHLFPQIYHFKLGGMNDLAPSYAVLSNDIVCTFTVHTHTSALYT